MSIAKGFLKEFEVNFDYLDNAKISESSLSRLLSQIKDPERDFVFLSAFKADKSKEVNRKRNKELMGSVLKPNKFGATKVVGAFRETGQENISKEETFFIVRPLEMTSKDFEKIVVKAVKDFDQNSALIGVNGVVHFINKAGSKSPPLTQIKNIDTKDLNGFYTRLKGYTFQFEGMYVPSSFSNAGAFEIDGLLYETDSI